MKKIRKLDWRTANQRRNERYEEKLQAGNTTKENNNDLYKKYKKDNK